MITVHVILNEDKSYLGFRVSGHADYDEYGKDIICASVSAVTLGTVNSIVELTDADVVYETGESGLLKFKFVGDSGHDAKLLMRSMLFSLESIAEQYGEEFLKIIYLEKLDNNYHRIRNQEV